MQAFHGTTILSVRDDKQVTVGGDGQVSIGDTIMKGNAVKVRKLYQDKVIAGYAGSTADAFTLLKNSRQRWRNITDNSPALQWN